MIQQNLSQPQLEASTREICCLDLMYAGFHLIVALPITFRNISGKLQWVNKRANERQSLTKITDTT
jgi:hypothetical protein